VAAGEREALVFMKKRAFVGGFTGQNQGKPATLQKSQIRFGFCQAKCSQAGAAWSIY
jgi:hypothetical protein